MGRASLGGSASAPVATLMTASATNRVATMANANHNLGRDAPRPPTQGTCLPISSGSAWPSPPFTSPAEAATVTAARSGCHGEDFETFASLSVSVRDGLTFPASPGLGSFAR